MSYVIQHEIDIRANREAVWDVLVDFPRYSEWSNFSRVEGTPQVGNRLSMKMPGFSFRPTVAVAEPGAVAVVRHAHLRAAVPRTALVHPHRHPGRRHSTHLTNHEEFSGGLTTLFQRFMKSGGDNGYTAFNAGLKRHVEDRAGQQGRT